ncbi:MAG: glycosyltransferase, partial [Tepidiformaceae bacterium]
MNPALLTENDATNRTQGWPPRGTPMLIYADEWGGIGGTANYVVMVAKGLVDRGYRTGVLCHDLAAMEPVMANLRSIGAEVLPVTPRAGAFRRIRAQVDLVRLARAYRGGLLAMMMGYHTRGGGVALAARVARLRAVVRADLTPPEPPFARFEGRALRLKDRLVDAVVVGAGENRESFAITLGRDRAKVHVIHTGIPLDRFEPGTGREAARQSLRLRDSDLLVGTVCRLSDRRKGVHDFVAMAAKVAAACPAAHFVVVGEGVLRPELEQMATSLGLENSLTFAGWAEDARGWYAAMDVFVMASTHEGGPTTLLEAMAMGRPVVATSVGMVPEVVEAGVSGEICPVSD